MDKKLTKLRDCFCNESCKLGKGKCGHCAQLWDKENTTDAEVLNQPADNAQAQTIRCGEGFASCWQCPSLTC